MKTMDDISKLIVEERRKRFVKSDQLSLGTLIEKLEACYNDAAQRNRSSQNADPNICFDFEYLRPSGLHSWRGSYDELAIDFSEEGTMLLSEFLPMLKNAVGQEFSGWKGGDFVMHEGTPLWVAHRRNSGHTAIIDVIDCGFQIILTTGYREF